MLTRFSEYVVVAFIVPLLLTLVCPIVKGVEPDGRESAQGLRQIVNGNRFEDHNYAFAIERPSSEWAFYLEDNIRELAPDACVGLINVATQGFFTVVPEPDNGFTLRDYTDRILENVLFEDAEVLHREPVKLADISAIEIEIRGKVDGLETAAVLFVLKRGDFFFQLTGWSLDRWFRGNEVSFHEIATSLEFLTDLSPQARATPSAPLEQHGGNWSIRGDRYSNASHGYEFEIPSTWRFASKTELHSINADATAGIISRSSPVCQAQVVETVGALDRDAFTSRIVEELDDRLGRDAQQISSREVEVAGLPGREFIFVDTSSGKGGHVVLTIFYRNDQCFQLNSWWSAGEKEACLREVRQTYDFFSFMDEDSCDQLEEQLTLIDSDNAVGPGYSYRGGVYRNYEHGFTYHRPAGTWLGYTGSDADEIIENAALVLESPAHGIHVVLIPSSIDGASHQDYHRSRLQDMDAPSGTEVKVELIDRGELLVSDFRIAVDGLPFRYLLCSTVSGDLVVDLVVYGFEANMDRFDSSLFDLRAGLRIPAQSPEPLIVYENTLTDHCLGYRLGTDAPGWRVRSLPSRHLSAVSSMASLSSENVECVAIGVCMDNLAEELAVDGILRVASDMGFRETSRSEAKDVLAGLPARRITLHGLDEFRQRVLTVWVARQANSLYGYLVIRNNDVAGESLATALEECKSFLSLLD